MKHCTVEPFTVTETCVPLKVVGRGSVEAKASDAGPMLEPNTLKIDPCAIAPLGSAGSAKLAAFFTPLAAMMGLAANPTDVAADVHNNRRTAISILILSLK